MSQFDSPQKLLQFQFRKFGKISPKFTHRQKKVLRYQTQNNFGSKWLKFSPDDQNMKENKV